MPRVTVDLARDGTLTDQWPWIPSIGKLFTGNGLRLDMSEIFSSGTINPKEAIEGIVLRQLLGYQIYDTRSYSLLSWIKKEILKKSYYRDFLP